MKFGLVAALCAGMISGAVAAQGVQYTTAQVELFSAANSGYLGTVDVATPVTVLAKKGTKAKVRIDGWTLVEYPSQVFADAGVRIEYSALDEEGAVKFNDKSPRRTVQENEWVKARVEGWVDAKALTKNLKGLWQQGQSRLADACSSCHGAPKADHFTANQWAATLPVKGGRAGHTRAGANALMFKYLQNNAKK